MRLILRLDQARKKEVKRSEVRSGKKEEDVKKGKGTSCRDRFCSAVKPTCSLEDF